MCIKDAWLGFCSLYTNKVDQYSTWLLIDCSNKELSIHVFCAKNKNVDSYKQLIVGDISMQQDRSVLSAHKRRLWEQEAWIIFVPVVTIFSFLLCEKWMAIINIPLSASFPLNLH